jgi:hypothetical protein
MFTLWPGQWNCSCVQYACLFVFIENVIDLDVFIENVIDLDVFRAGACVTIGIGLYLVGELTCVINCGWSCRAGACVTIGIGLYLVGEPNPVIWGDKQLREKTQEIWIKSMLF